MAPFKELFRYATKQDFYLIAFGLLMAMISGSASPLIAGFLGNITNVFDITKSPEEIFEEAAAYSLKFLIYGGIIFLFIMAGSST